MGDEQIPITPATKVILDCVKDELLPSMEELKKSLVQLQKLRISFQPWSPKLTKLEAEYSEVSSKFFEVVRKLETPDILFEGLADNPRNIAEYFQYSPAFQRTIIEGIRYSEIIDRTLDRKSQGVQNSRALLVSLAAIILSAISLLG